MAMSRKTLPAAWGTVPMIVTAQKTCSQIHQSATIEAEQAVSFLSRTAESA